MSESKTLEKLDEVGVDGLVWLQDFASKGVGFIEEQAPELCREIVMLGMAKAIFGLVVFIVLAVITAIWLKIGTTYIFKRLDKDFCMDVEPPEVVFGWILPGGVMIGAMIGVLVNSYAAMVIWAAPRVYLLEYFADLLEKGSGG